uniref:Uncharacterized protein n=1 Tax=Ciona savignyi TaxID=51511 RepID=H2Y5U2_CIOSA
MLKLIKAKFNFDTGSQLRYNRTPLPSGHKRKVGDFGSTPPVKKRMKEEKSDDSVFISPPPPLCFGLPINMRSSAFKPWHSALAQARDFPHHHEALAKVLGPVLHNRVIPDHLLASSNIMPRTELPSKENQFPQVKPEAGVQNSSHNVQQERRRSEGDEKRLKEKQTQPTSLSTLVAESRIKEKVEVHTPVKNTKSERVSRDSSTPSLTPKCKENDEERDKSNRSCDRMSSDSEPKKPSPSKPAYDKTTQIIGTSVDVAAASAMLELSSSGQHRKLSVEKESTPKSISMQYSLASPSRSQVVPLDSSHRLFKWTFDSSSYIISASGTQEIRMLETMLEKGADRQQVVHGLVKMKYRYEEKLDIQERVKRDLEAV